MTDEDTKTICLIVPPSVFLLDERVFMNLGILRVAAVLEEANYRIELLDLSGTENYVEAVSDHVRTSKATAFGLTATTPQVPAAVKICQAIRQSRPDAKIILGGPHVTLVNVACKTEQQSGTEGRATRTYNTLARLFDVLVAGDGEEAIFVALQADAPKLVDADDPKSTMFLTNRRLNELPFPARHLIDVDSYHYHIDGMRALSLIAQLGCPFACGFCGGRFSPSLRRVRLRSSENVLAEILHLHETYGVNGFMLYDDELNVNPKMVELMHNIAELQVRLGQEFRLRGFVKAELFTDEQAEAMYQAGFRWILTGFESGSPRILRNINKKASQEDNTRCVEIAKRHGLKVKALMSLGHPGESVVTIQDTHNWLLEVEPDDFDVTIITTYPGTPYYDRAVPHPTEKGVWTYEYNGDRLHAFELDYTEVENYYKGSPDGGYRSYVYTDYLSAEEIVEHRDRVERDVREKLGIPFNPGAPAIRYEHSMGQMGAGLPPNILRTTSDKAQEVLTHSSDR